MSKSRLVNKINFYSVFIFSSMIAFVISVVHVGGLDKVSAIGYPAVFGYFLGTLAGILGTPLLIAWCCAVIKQKIKKTEYYNLSYILVWILVLLFVIRTF